MLGCSELPVADNVTRCTTTRTIPSWSRFGAGCCAAMAFGSSGNWGSPSSSMAGLRFSGLVDTYPEASSSLGNDENRGEIGMTSGDTQN
jgi:hypothetical protein